MSYIARSLVKKFNSEDLGKFLRDYLCNITIEILIDAQINRSERRKLR